MGYALNNIRVLIVDENTHFRQLLRTILQAVGARTIDMYDSAASGFETYCRHDYDMVFTDSAMAPLSGFQFVDLIRTSHQSRNPYVSIIMLSSLCNTEHIKLARDHGVTEFLAKPLSVDTVLKRIEAVIENPRPFVRTSTYFGPDRRRKSSLDYAGPERRSLAAEELALSRQDIAIQQRSVLKENIRVVDELVRC